MLSLTCGRDRYGVPVVSGTKLEQFAEELIGDFRPDLLKSPQPTNIEQFVECYLRANLEVRPNTVTNAILGVAVFNEGCVPVYDRMKGSLVPLDVPDHTILIEEGIYNRLEPGVLTSRWLTKQAISSAMMAYLSVTVLSADRFRREPLSCAARRANAIPGTVRKHRWTGWNGRRTILALRC